MSDDPRNPSAPGATEAVPAREIRPARPDPIVTTTVEAIEAAVRAALKHGEAGETVEERVFFHEDDAFHVRTDWFLVGHGILFEAFVAAAQEDKWIAYAVGAFGLVAAWCWLAVSLRQVQNLDAMKSAFRRAAVPYDVAQSERALRDRKRNGSGRDGPLSMRAAPVFGKVLPWACTLVWIVVLARLWWLPHRP